MRCFVLSLSAASLLLLPACSFRSRTSESEVSAVAPQPILDSPPVSSPDQTVAQVEPAAVNSPPEFTLDPAPAPPPESSSSLPEQSSTEGPSAEDVFNSIARVLQGAGQGDDDETDVDSKGSVFGSIGRALSQGFQEAVAGESAKDE